MIYLVAFLILIGLLIALAMALLHPQGRKVVFVMALICGGLYLAMKHASAPPEPVHQYVEVAHG